MPILTPHEILGPSGRIAARLTHYECRPRAIGDGRGRGRAPSQGPHHLIAEAGTGVGKSFAYLVPAILAVAQPGETDAKTPPRRVIVSTHTISLQEQLLNKDLPLLNSVIPLEFSAVLVKGRHNYLSLRRMGLAASRASSLFRRDEEFDEVRGLAAWSRDDERRFAGRSGVSSAAQRVGRGRKRQRQLPGPAVPDVQRLLLLSGPPPRAKCADPDRQSRAVLQRSGAAPRGRQHPARLRRRRSSTKPTSSNRWPATTWASISRRARSSTCSTSCTTNARSRGLLVHHQLAEAQQEVEACRYRADEFFAPIGDWVAAAWQDHDAAWGSPRSSKTRSARA